MEEMGAHVAQSNDGGAHMAFCRPGAVEVFMWGEVREERFRGGRKVEVVGLRDEEVAELADDEFSGTDGCSVVGEEGERGGCVGAGGTGERLGRVIDGEMFPFAEKRVSVKRVVRTMPVVSPFRRGFFEDRPALRTQDVVS